jgi:hypothetical protein
MHARLIVAAVLSGIGLLTGCGPVDGSSAAAPPHGKSVALRQLDALRVAKWASMAGYSRERFPHWSAQGDGCDTRDVVLRRSGEAVLTTAECRITQGSWLSPYDGRATSDPQDLDIDHMVPLANAWRTGAAKWTDAAREDFANDLVRPELIAVTSSTNRSKGDQDPSQWRPPKLSYWCEYAQQWVAVKTYWKLSVTALEKAALKDMLGTC